MSTHEIVTHNAYVQSSTNCIDAIPISFNNGSICNTIRANDKAYDIFDSPDDITCTIGKQIVPLAEPRTEP